MTWRAKAASLTVALATLVVVSACSSSTTSSGGALPSGSTSAAIKLGMICSCSGPFGTNISVGGHAIEAWAKATNAAGGIGGRQVDLIVKDDTGNPGTSVTEAQSLIASKVAAIIDLSPMDAVWEKQVDAAKIPVVGGNLAAAQYFTDPNFYPAGETDDSTAAATLVAGKAAGATNFADLYCAEAPQCAQGVPVLKAAGGKIGLPDVYDSSIAATAPNYTAQCLAAKQAGATAVFIGGAAATIARVAQDCATQDYHPYFLEFGTGFTGQLPATAALKNTLVASFPVLPYFASGSQLAAFNTALDTYFPGDRSNTVGWSEITVQAWASGVLVADAVKGAGVAASAPVTAADITRGLDSISNDDLGGLVPPLSFTAGKVHSVSCWYTGGIKNGSPVILNGGKLSCAS
jgi:branched-chain amino acid transport system substrate-binding protein